MRRRALAHLLTAAVLAGLTASAATVIAHADTGFRMSEYTLTGSNYKVSVPRTDIDGVDGPYLAARDEFNSSLRGAADGYIAKVTPTLNLSTSVNFTYVGPHLLSAKLGVNYFAEHAAHPYEDFTTHTTSLDSGKAIQLQDVFTDLNAGLTVLSKQAAILVPKTNAGDTYYKDGILPTVDNYRNWAVDSGGMRIYFGEIGSHAAGNIVITVPWSALSSVLSPQMKALVA
ncbi:RsiV family protein [Nocardia sp. NPDC056100]|uniref:RsiV family protein n=1 Tax=Nocardia sp. NPDC056100 TaxID=3345712 RepID=UPI0035DC34FE